MAPGMDGSISIFLGYTYVQCKTMYVCICYMYPCIYMCLHERESSKLLEILVI